MNSKETMADVRHRIEKARFVAAKQYYPDRLAKVSGSCNVEDLIETNKVGSQRTVNVVDALLFVARA